MENQHRRIRGYRELSAEEIALMNEIKLKGEELGDLIDRLADHVHDQRVAASVLPGEAGLEEGQRLDATEPEEWLRTGKKQLQIGLMAITRAVAQPTFF
jgi:hypothetical protein